MTATERLRQLLDERGVEWHGTGSVYGDDFDATESVWKDDALDVTLYGVSPEHAVEATLGRGTCKVEGSIDYGEFGCWQYDLSCGCRILWPDSEPPAFCPECGRRVEP